MRFEVAFEDRTTRNTQAGHANTDHILVATIVVARLVRMANGIDTAVFTDELSNQWKD